MKAHKGFAVAALPLVPILLGALTWGSTKAIPAWWKHHIQRPSKVQVELAKDLCDNHGDCEAEKKWAMKGVETPVQIQGDQAVEGK